MSWRRSSARTIAWPMVPVAPTTTFLMVVPPDAILSEKQDGEGRPQSTPHHRTQTLSASSGRNQGFRTEPDLLLPFAALDDECGQRLFDGDEGIQPDAHPLGHDEEPADGEPDDDAGAVQEGSAAVAPMNGDVAAQDSESVLFSIAAQDAFRDRLTQILREGRADGKDVGAGADPARLSERQERIDVALELDQR